MENKRAIFPNELYSHSESDYDMCSDKKAFGAWHVHRQPFILLSASPRVYSMSLATNVT